MTRTVVSQVRKADDLEVHVSRVQEDAEEFIEVREFVPSIYTYGRGILLPKSMAANVAYGVLAAMQET